MQSNPAQSTPDAPPIKAYLAIFLAIATISAAAILIRLALNENMPPTLIAGARLFIASIVLTPITLRRHLSDFKILSRNELLLAIISGVFLAIHFIAWASSLQLTTVLVSVVIVSTVPIWVAILEVIFLRLHLTRLVSLGLVIALSGAILIGIPGGDETLSIGSESDTTLNGAILAWIGAVTVSVYMLIGRKLRKKLPIIPYIWLVYGIATLAMLVVIVLTATPVTGFRAEGYLVLLAMGLIPQLLGHSSLNYVLEYFPATMVSMFAQLEPIGSAILAYFVFTELPPPQQIIGSAIIMLGVLMASRGKIS